MHKTTGIILHTINYSEKKIIVKAYTRHFGLQSYIINDVRSKKSKNKITLFQPLTIVDIVTSVSNKGKLQRISEIAVHQPYTTIPYDIIKSSIAIFINEILYKSLKEEHEDAELFEFIKNSLLMFDLEMAEYSNFHIYFMIQFSKYLGFYPQGKYSASSSIFDLQEGYYVNTLPVHTHYITTPISELLHEFLVAGRGYGKIKISKNSRKQLLAAIIHFYRLHLMSFGELKSYKILEEIAE